MPTSLIGSNTHNRFIKVPAALAKVMFYVTYATVVVYASMFLPDTFYGGIAWLISLVASLFVAKILASLAHRSMMRDRLWEFGKNHFSTWDHFAKWLNMTNPVDLDFICGEADDSWEPDTAKGGYRLLEPELDPYGES